jgi:hypothetical protein
VPRNQKKSDYFREMLAISEAIAKFRHYLLGHKFIIKTDQKSLKNLMDQTLQTPEQQQWLHKFLGYDFTIEYKPGKENVAADALSRMMSLAWSAPQSTLIQEIKDALQSNPQLLDIMSKCLSNPQSQTHYAVRNELLYYKERIVIPVPSTLPHKLLQEYHSSPIGVHAGVTRTVAMIKINFTGPTYIKMCKSSYKIVQFVNKLR